MQTPIEQLRGSGEVFRASTEVGYVEYDIRVYQKIQSTRAGAISGLTQIQGRVWSDDAFTDLYELFKTKEVLTLHLEDGRKLDFGLKDPKGTLFATGKGLYE